MLIAVEVELPGEAQVVVTMPWSRAAGIMRDLRGLNRRSSSSDELLRRLDETVGSAAIDDAAGAGGLARPLRAR